MGVNVSPLPPDGGPRSPAGPFLVPCRGTVQRASRRLGDSRSLQSQSALGAGLRTTRHGSNNVQQNPGCFRHCYRGACPVCPRGLGKRSKSQRHLALRARAELLPIGRPNLQRQPIGQRSRRFRALRLRRSAQCPPQAPYRASGLVLWPLSRLTKSSQVRQLSGLNRLSALAVYEGR